MSLLSFYFEKGEFVLKVKRVAKAKKSGTLVFQNKMNSILFPVNFTAFDYDIFFTICWYVKQQGYTDSRQFIEMPYSELTRFFDKSWNKTRVNEQIDLFGVKVLGRDGAAVYRSIIPIADGFYKSVGVFFIKIDTFRNKQILKFKMSTDALDVLFGVLKFMKIDLNKFVSIRGKFAKILYRLLLQYENIKADRNGFKCVNFNRSDFENLMAVPSGYDATDLDRRVLTPSLSELDKTYFEKILFEPIYSAGSKKIQGYSFKFLC